MLKSYRSWLAWFIASLFYLYEYTHRVSISVMIPELSAAFHASATDIGRLSASYFYVYALMQIPAGLLVDRYSSKFILPISAIITGLGCLLFAQTNQLLLANFARGLIGFGSAFAFISCLKIAAQQLPLARFALLVGLTNFLGAIGGIIGGEPYLSLVRTFGWRSITTVSGYIALFFALIMYLVINPNNNLANPKVNSQQLTKRFSLRDRQMWLIALLGSLMIAPISTYTQLWGPSFLQAHNSLNIEQASLLSSSTFLGIAFGGPLIGYLNNYFSTSRSLLYIGACGALSSLLMILFITSSGALYLVIIHLLLGLFTSTMLLCFSLGTNNLAATDHGLMIGTLNAIITFVGGSFQIIAGNIIEHTQKDILLGMLPLLGCYVICLIIITRIRDNNVT